MSLKRMLLLASMALAAIAFAVPATASAWPQTTWTNWNPETEMHEHLEAEQTAKQSFEGFLKFEPTGAPIPTSFGCDVTVTIEAIGPTGGKVKVFNPTTDTCVGTGLFNSCVLEEDTSNVRDGETYNWGITVNTQHLVVKHTDPEDDITIHNKYATGCFFTESHLEFGEVTVTPTLDEGTITHLSIDATTTNGAVHASGSVTPEEPTEADPDLLGLTADE